MLRQLVFNLPRFTNLPATQFWKILVPLLRIYGVPREIITSFPDGWTVRVDNYIFKTNWSKLPSQLIRQLNWTLYQYHLHVIVSTGLALFCWQPENIPRPIAPIKYSLYCCQFTSLSPTERKEILDNFFGVEGHQLDSVVEGFLKRQLQIYGNDLLIQSKQGGQLF